MCVFAATLSDAGCVSLQGLVLFTKYGSVKLGNTHEDCGPSSGSNYRALICCKVNNGSTEIMIITSTASTFAKSTGIHILGEVSGSVIGIVHHQNKQIACTGTL